MKSRKKIQKLKSHTILWDADVIQTEGRIKRLWGDMEKLHSSFDFISVPHHASCRTKPENSINAENFWLDFTCKSYPGCITKQIQPADVEDAVWELIYNSISSEPANDIDHAIYFERVNKITKAHIAVFNHFESKQIAALNEELIELQKQLQKSRTKELALQIKLVIANIKALAYQFLLFRIRQINSAKNSLTSFFSRNLRSMYRRVIQIIFKNLDDEAHSGIVVIPKRTALFSTLNLFHHDFQRESNPSLKRCYLC